MNLPDSALWELLGEPRLDSISELFHENSKIRPGAGAVAISPDVVQVMPDGFKQYPRAETVALGPPRALALPLGQAIQRRRSVRAYAGTPIGADALSTLLFHAYGQTTAGFRRAVPSAGALYPSELYALLLQGESLPNGLYHYDVRAHQLELIGPPCDRSRLAAAMFIEDLAMTASVFLVITSVFGRSTIKYTERGYRFALLEAGHIAQNICLSAAALELAACPIGGFVDDEVNDLLDLDGVDEAALYLVAVGGRLDDEAARAP